MAFTEKYVTVTGGGLHDGSSEANAWTFDEAVANVSAGDRVNVKVGNHTCTAASTVNGTYASPIAVRGYQTTIGDLDDVKLAGLVAGTDMPKVDVTGNRRGFIGEFFLINHLSYHGSGNFQTITKTSNNSHVRACRFVNTATAAYGLIDPGRTTFIDCYFESVTTSTAAGGGGGNNIIYKGCVFNGKGSGGTAVSQGSFLDCIFVGWTRGIWYQYPDPVAISNCTFVDCTTAIEITISYGNPLAVLGCYFDSCTTAFKNTAANGNHFIDGCCYRNVTTELSGVDSQSNRKTDASDSFVDSAANDYTLTSSSAGYAATNPTAFAEFETVNARDIGAIQHTDPSGGGAGTYHPLYLN